MIYTPSLPEHASQKLAETFKNIVVAGDVAQQLRTVAVLPGGWGLILNAHRVVQGNLYFQSLGI